MNVILDFFVLQICQSSKYWLINIFVLCDLIYNQNKRLMVEEKTFKIVSLKNVILIWKMINIWYWIFSIFISSFVWPKKVEEKVFFKITKFRINISSEREREWRRKVFWFNIFEIEPISNKLKLQFFFNEINLLNKFYFKEKFSVK